MKMIRAIVRPDKADEVVEGLKEAGFPALTRWDVAGRGKQAGLRVGSVHYDELPKVMLMMVCADDQVGTVLEVIQRTAYTGNFGDGKVFVSPVEEAYTIRTRSAGL